MAIQYNENIKIAAPAPLDKRYLSTRTSSGAQLPYSACTEVNTLIIPSERYTGLTVNILGTEYWYKDGILDACLIEKKYDAVIPQSDFITGATNLGFFSGKTGLQTLPIDNLVNNDYDGNYVSLYNYYYRGTDGKIHTNASPVDNIYRRGYYNSVKNKSWVWNEYLGSSNLRGWIFTDGNIENQIGTFQIGATYYTGLGISQPYTAATWTAGSSYNNGSSAVINTVIGSVLTGSTFTMGGPVYNYSEDNRMHFRTLRTTTPDFIRVCYDESFVYLSGATSVITGQNVGTGACIYSQKTGSTLQFRTLVGSGDTTVVQSGNVVRIFSTNSGSSGYALTGVTNLGSGVAICDNVSFRNLGLRSIMGSGDTTVALSGSTIIVRSTGTGILTGATNGLRLLEGRTVVLGGDLSSGTTINGLGVHDFSLTNIDEFQVTTTGGSTVFGLDNNGFLASFSGGSATFDDNGGIKYAGDYSSNYTNRSLVDAGYVTGKTSNINNLINYYTGTTAPNTYLKLNQSTPQHVICSQPIFDQGIIIGATPLASQTSGHTTGRMYYDTDYETVSIDINDVVTLQVGQETMRYTYNSSGVVIPNGAVVYETGVGGSGVQVSTIALAIATGYTKSAVLGITIQEIGVNSYGFVMVRGHVNDINTSTGSLYSGMTVGQTFYLSDTVLGGVTGTPPSSPSVQVALGRLITKDTTTGKVFVNIFSQYRLNDIVDVNVPSPAIDQVLKWNGLEWVNANVGTASASNGVNFYYSTPAINSRTQPVGLSQDGTIGSGVQVMSLSKTPVTAGGTLYMCACASGDTRAAVAWLYDHPLCRTQIDAGTWEFNSWFCIDSSAGVSTVTNNIYQVVPITGSTVTTSGFTANARRAIISSNQFNDTYFSASTINTNASWLQTPSGIYQICAKINNNNVCIVVPTGYLNETEVTGNTWNKLFGAVSPEIDGVAYTLYETYLAEPTFSISCTDKLGRIGFVTSSALHYFGLTYNGNAQASYFNTPLVTLHNDLSELQGGTGSERVHITCAQAVVVANTSGVNTGDETKSSIESKLTGVITSHTHPYSGLTGIPSLVSASTFNAYTAITTPIINKAITGVTSVGTGTSIISGTTAHDVYLNKIKGSGSTIIQKVGNDVVIYSTGGTGSDYVFPTDLTVSIAAGKTFGKYCNGDIIPASGKTAVQVIQMAVLEALEPTLNLGSTSTNVVFGESGKTVNLCFNYTINTLGATVSSAKLEYCRTGSPSWSTLSTTTTTPSSYLHNINDSSNRFCTNALNYRYCVVDTAGASGMTTYTITPQAYAAPTMSPTYMGTLLSYETQQIREKGNIQTTIAGGASSNRSLVYITGYTIQRCVDGGAFTNIATCTGICTLTPTITSCLDGAASAGASTIGYRISIGDQYTSNNSSTYTINFRYASYYGYSTNTTLSSAQVVGLGNQALCTSKARTMTLTAPSGNYTYVAYPESYGWLTNAIMDGAAPVLGAFSCCCDNSVVNYYGQTVDYIIYKSNATQAFTNNSVAFS